LRRKLIHIGSGRIAVAVVTLAAGCLVAACGSASSSSSTTASASSSGSPSSSAGGGATGSARRAQLVACMKSHGVTLPSRPPGGGPPPGAPGAGAGGAGTTGTGTTGTGTSTTPRRNFFFGGGGARNISPKTQAAFKACGAQFGFRGGAGGFRGRLSHTAITEYVTCVRQHGYNLPNPNFSGKGPIFPANIRSNAKFQAASKTCQNLLVPPRPSGGTSTTSGA